MIVLKFNIPYFIYFTISFMIFTVIGTVSHEYGHIIVAKSYGYKTTLYHASMKYDNKAENRNIDLYYAKNEIKIEKGLVEKELFSKMVHDKNRKSFWVTVGGPAQTIFTGFVGLFILYTRKNNTIFKVIDWLAVFLSLFWLREVFNFIQGMINGLFFNRSYFGGDEYWISYHLKLPIGTISIILGTIGLLISLFVIFKIIPKYYRLTFITSGLIGGLSGFYLWNIFGPKLFLFL